MPKPWLVSRAPGMPKRQLFCVKGNELWEGPQPIGNELWEGPHSYGRGPNLCRKVC
mgnify:CR=1 FL=1